LFQAIVVGEENGFFGTGIERGKKKSRPGITPNGFLMRLPARHCSGSIASICRLMHEVNRNLAPAAGALRDQGRYVPCLAMIGKRRI
jgi:hypothetical protein